MIFVYIDDILSVSHQAKEAILEITSYYKAKEGSIKEPHQKSAQFQVSPARHYIHIYLCINFPEF